MKNEKSKLLNAKLLKEIKKVIQNNKAQLSEKVEKTLRKSIKKIVKRTARNRKNVVLDKAQELAAV